MRADPNESAPPIDLPLHQREPEVREEPSPLRDTIHAADTSPSSSSGGRRGIALGMLVVGLLAGFGAGFVVGQRLTPPAPPRAVDVPRPAPVVPAAPVAPSPPVVEPAVVAPAVVAPPVAEVPVPVVEPDVIAPPTPPPAAVQKPVARPAIQPATIRFDSKPPGATIYLDEMRIGVTPLTMNNVSPGEHQVRLEMLGHDTWRTSLTVKAGEQYFLGASLE